MTGRQRPRSSASAGGVRLLAGNGGGVPGVSRYVDGQALLTSASPGSGCPLRLGWPSARRPAARSGGPVRTTTPGVGTSPRGRSAPGRCWSVGRFGGAGGGARTLSPWVSRLASLTSRDGRIRLLSCWSMAPQHLLLPSAGRRRIYRYRDPLATQGPASPASPRMRLPVVGMRCWWTSPRRPAKSAA
jgi:hypothetical protein